MVLEEMWGIIKETKDITIEGHMNVLTKLHNNLGVVTSINCYTTSGHVVFFCHY